MFNCERANVVLVHRYKQFLFRIVKEGNDDCYSVHEMAKGISGMIALSARPRITAEIDKQFVKEIDDPNWKAKSGAHEAYSLLSVPVFTNEEFDNFGKQNNLLDTPRAVIHLINKRPFGQSDHLSANEL